MKKLLKKILNRETILYLVFGLLTTAVNTIAFSWFFDVFGMTSWLAKTLAFCCAVTFAFLTNKPFVFQSKSWKAKVVIRELSAFILTRLAAFLLELLCLSVLDYMLHVGRYTLLGINGVTAAQFILSLISVVLNYIFSKFFIFKKSSKT